MAKLRIFQVIKMENLSISDQSLANIDLVNGGFQLVLRWLQGHYESKVISKNL